MTGQGRGQTNNQQSATSSPTSTSTSTPTAGLNSGILGSTSSVLTAELRSYLRQFGLEGMAGWAATTGSLSVDEFVIELEQQQVYRERFAPVFARREAIARGEATIPITPEMVMEAEQRDRALEQEFGLPANMIDTFERLNGDVSGTEIRERVQLAVEDAREAYGDENGRAYLDAAFQNIPGLSEGGIVALFLDPEVALPKLRDAVSSARVASGAGAAGFKLTNAEADEVSRRGLSEEDARQAFGELSNLGELTRTITGEAGDGFSRSDQIALAAGDPVLRNRLESVARRRAAQFQGGGSFAGGTAGIA